MYTISRRGKPTRGFLPAWGLGEVLRTARHKKNGHSPKRVLMSRARTDCVQ
jgi:hypothetical protein